MQTEQCVPQTELQQPWSQQQVEEMHLRCTQHLECDRRRPWRLLPCPVDRQSTITGFVREEPCFPNLHPQSFGRIPYVPAMTMFLRGPPLIWQRNLRLNLETCLPMAGVFAETGKKSCLAVGLSFKRSSPVNFDARVEGLLGEEDRLAMFPLFSERALTGMYFFRFKTHKTL